MYVHTASSVCLEKIAATFRADGFVGGLPVLTGAEAARYLAKLEDAERCAGGSLPKEWNHKAHLLFTWANELIRHPAILDAVEAVIGRDIACWTCNFFIKEPGDRKFVSWHQDSDRWNFEPAEMVTAWLALSDAPVESGAMRMLRGSHRHGSISHTPQADAHNMLSRGQVVDLPIDPDLVADVPLKPGQISLHHVHTVHGSLPNLSGARRIGLAIRYVPAHMRQSNGGKYSATLVRGVNRHGHFDEETSPASDLSDAAIAAQQAAYARLKEAVY